MVPPECTQSSGENPARIRVRAANLAASIGTMADVLEPEERAIWRLLLDVTIGDHLTVAEISATASAAGHQRITEFTVQDVLRPLLRDGHAVRMWIRRWPRIEKTYGYALTLPGRARGHRLLDS